MSIAQTVRSIKNIWNHGDEEEYESDDVESSQDEPAPTSYTSSYRNDKTTYPSSYQPTHGGSAGSVRKLKPVATPIRREKNIYTLKPTSLDEAAIAADYLKTGSAVVLNLETVDRVNSVRIIDFMSGVCYGIDGQGHAMKLGETIFLFTPNDFEISSDETDYGENVNLFFKDVEAAMTAAAAPHKTASEPQWATSGAAMPAATPYAAERRTWER